MDRFGNFYSFRKFEKAYLRKKFRIFEKFPGCGNIRWLVTDLSKRAVVSIWIILQIYLCNGFFSESGISGPLGKSRTGPLGLWTPALNWNQDQSIWFSHTIPSVRYFGEVRKRAMPHFSIVFKFFLWCLKGALSLISLSVGSDSARHLAEVTKPALEKIRMSDK